MKARIKFSKTGSMRFIGHLDVMRYFQKAFRRAGVKMCYSQGFSPHPLMSFTSPLGIGLGSDAEYLDIVLEEPEAPAIMESRINAVLNDEIRVKSFILVKDNAKPSMSVLAACDYLVAVKPGRENRFCDQGFTEEKINGFIMQDKIEVIKKAKKPGREDKLADIRGGIYNIAGSIEKFQEMTGRDYGTSCIDSRCVPVFYCRLAAGSTVNIRPELVTEALCKYAGIEYNKFSYQIHRTEMYAKADRNFVAIAEYDTCI